MFGDNLNFWSILCCFIIIVKTGFKMASSSKRENRSVGPISIHGDGKSYDIHYDAFVDHISRHVCHADEFPPALTWPDHKNSGRVERLYRELTVSIWIINIVAYVYALVIFKLKSHCVVCRMHFHCHCRMTTAKFQSTSAFGSMIMLDISGATIKIVPCIVRTLTSRVLYPMLVLTHWPWSIKRLGRVSWRHIIRTSRMMRWVM